MSSKSFYLFILSLFSFCSLLFCSLLADHPLLIPEPLKKGDLVAIVFPGFYLEEDETEEVLFQKASFLEKRGYRIIFYPEHPRREGYFSGTDKERAESLMEAWKNDEVKAIWCYRGGYGSQRILDFLDFDYIKEHPKVFIGMSDITALHQALFQKTGLVTYLGPVLKFFTQDKNFFDNEYAFHSLENLFEKKGECNFLPWKREVIAEGKGEGPLTGGNLTMIASLCGTKWQLNTKGKILLLEDINEEVYKIDRMLLQLKEAGLLEKPAGVILASWKKCGSSDPQSFTLDQVFNSYFKDANYPVIKNYPSGHCQYQLTLPLNTLFEIDTEEKL